MKKTAEQRIVVNATEGTKITRTNVKIADDGKNVEIQITSEVMEEHESKKEANATNNVSIENFDEMFPIVEVSKLSLDDEFLKHKPKTKKQRKLKNSIVEGIKFGLSDFRCPTMDPSEDKNGNIIFKKGSNPAVGHTSSWWDKKALQFMPTKNSREGIQKEYDAFLGVLIKELLNLGYTVEEAWEAVCDDSCELGHYKNSKNSKPYLEPTGSRKVGRWYDLANTYKIIKKDDGSGYLIASGSNAIVSDYSSLSTLAKFYYPYEACDCSVGWVVLDV